MTATLAALERIAQDARNLRVSLRNATPRDPWFIDNAAYGIAQEIQAAENRLLALHQLRARVAAEHDAAAAARKAV